jgi:hypothetical protein
MYRHDPYSLVARLMKLTSGLQLTGLLVVLGVLAQLVTLIIGIFSIITQTFYVRGILSDLAIINIGLFALDIMALIAHELMRRNADAVFVSLSEMRNDPRNLRGPKHI